MGMIANIICVSENDLNSYLADSSVLEEQLNTVYSSTENKSLSDIDKSWEGIIYLLTGGSIAESYEHPLAAVLFSGQLINEEQDLGYGPAHYLTPEQVSDLNSRISSFTASELRERYNPEDMNNKGIYPQIWDNDQGFAYLMENFEIVKAIYSRAAANNEAIITFLS